MLLRLANSGFIDETGKIDHNFSTDTKVKNFSFNYPVDSDRVLSIEEEFQ